MGHLNQLQEKYFDKGLRVIGISNEPPGTIQSKFIEAEGAKYWLGSDPGGATAARFKSGGGGIPHAYLIDASGRVVADMHPASLAESRIEELLDGVFDPALERELHRSLKAAAKEYAEGKVGKAWTAAARYLESDDRALVGDAEYLRGKCVVWADFRKRLIEDAIKQKDFETAYDDLADVAKHFAGMEVALWAAETRKSLDADPAVATERKAFKAYLKAVAKEAKAGGKAKKLGPARKAYKSVVKRYTGTRAAALAELALKRLGTG